MFVPGFFLVEDQDDIISGFRGLAPDNNSKVMLLVNGQNINTEYFWGPPDAVLNTLEYDWIDHVEVIRGPGSVTLGQGALLGVINIVTKKGGCFINNNAKGALISSFGSTGKDDGYIKGGLEAQFKHDDISGYFHLGAAKYNGQHPSEFDKKGFMYDQKNEGYFGGNVATSGNRLKRSNTINAIGNLFYKGLELNFFMADQIRDLYNFYRDRDVVAERILSLGGKYDYSVNENMTLTTKVSAIRDDWSLSSAATGLTTGGTGEERFGGIIMGSFKDLFQGNTLVLGTEYRRFQYGRKNLQGANFIVNNINVDSREINNNVVKIFETLGDANLSHTYIYPEKIDVFSLFLEDFYKINDSITVFAAARFDTHPDWGAHISPRIGAFLNSVEGLRLRLSYQSGFRGAVGVHFSGGFRNDGYLSEDSFNKIEDAKIPVIEGEDPNFYPGSTILQNIEKTEPEKMHSFELDANYDVSKNLIAGFVGFYNIIENVIGVDSFAGNAGPSSTHVYDMPNIGDDIVGDWNGYWFYKNVKGNLTQWGVEAILTYADKYFKANLSYSLVKLGSVDEEQKNNMYVTGDGNIRAYPENVTRLNLISTPIPKLTLAITGLYYFDWNSPRDQKVKGNVILNAGVGYELLDGFELSIIGKNLAFAKELYPMNSNAGGGTVQSDGTHGIEYTTFWCNLNYSF